MKTCDKCGLLLPSRETCPRCEDQPPLAEASGSALRDAVEQALVTNGGPIDGADTVDGESYVMVRMDAFLKLESVFKSSPNNRET